MSVWRNTPELFIMSHYLRYAERERVSRFSDMKNKSQPLKDDWVLPLQNGFSGPSPQRTRPALHQTRTWFGRHELHLRRQLLVLTALSFTIASCASEATIVNETETGGTVLYSYIEEQDVLHSPGRSDALLLLDEKCKAGYRISREGQIAQINKAVDKAWMGQISRDGQVNREKRWAIQFVCN
jgi:hypothetical protein